MKYHNRNARLSMASVTLLALIVTTVAFWFDSCPAAEQRPGDLGLPREEILRLGELLYRKGILPSGEPMTALVQGDTPVEGTMFSCESCHMRSGLGSYEGGVWTTSTTGRDLYRPLTNARQVPPSELDSIPAYLRPMYQAPPRRPAYTDDTLAVALRDGIDPTGRKLHLVMPRYLLEDRDMAILIEYLKTLSAEPSPGVTDTTIRFATVVSDDVTKNDRDAMLTALDNYVRGRNNQAKKFETRARYGFFAENMDLSYRRLSLARWELKGPPDTWRRQLEEYYRKEPVFALLGGITGGEWRPIHEFSEEYRIPSIFPITDFPVISETDWYTVYFSKGLYQEGEAAARFIGASADIPGDRAVVQIFRDTREGRALSDGFEKTWRDLGRQAPVNRMLPQDAAITKEFLAQVTEKDRPAALLLWLGPEAVQVVGAIAEGTTMPEMVYVSSSLLKQSLEKLPEKARGFTYLTYPHGHPDGRTLEQVLEPAKRTRRNGAAPADDRKIASRMHTLSLLMTDVLMMMRQDYYRDRFLDIIDMFQDKPRPYSDYERLSFGPGQRYTSKGCYIVQLTPGPNPEMLVRSEWVIH